MSIDHKAAAQLSARLKDVCAVLDALSAGGIPLEIKSPGVTTETQSVKRRGRPTASPSLAGSSHGPARAKRVGGGKSRKAAAPDSSGSLNGQEVARRSREEMVMQIRAAVVAHPSRSDAEIAEKVGCHRSTVAKQRQLLESGEALRDDGSDDQEEIAKKKTL